MSGRCLRCSRCPRQVLKQCTAVWRASLQPFLLVLLNTSLRPSSCSTRPSSCSTRPSSCSTNLRKCPTHLCKRSTRPCEPPHCLDRPSTPQQCSRRFRRSRHVPSNLGNIPTSLRDSSFLAFSTSPSSPLPRDLPKCRGDVSLSAEQPRPCIQVESAPGVPRLRSESPDCPRSRPAALRVPNRPPSPPTAIRVPRPPHELVKQRIDAT